MGLYATTPEAPGAAPRYELYDKNHLSLTVPNCSTNGLGIPSLCVEK